MAIREVKKGECVIIGDFNHGHIQWESLESAGGDDRQFLLLTQDCFLTQHVLEPTRERLEGGGEKTVREKTEREGEEGRERERGRYR